MEKESDNKSWTELKVKIKQIYPQLTGSDLALRNGTKEELIGQLANTLRITRKELRTIIAGL